jgi:hypothetical protein
MVASLKYGLKLGAYASLIICIAGLLILPINPEPEVIFYFVGVLVGLSMFVGTFVGSLFRFFRAKRNPQN